MCAVSNVGDSWTQKWQGQGYGLVQQGNGISTPPISTLTPLVSHYEFEQLKKEVLQMKVELAAAKRQDELDGAPDCEMEEKVAALKAVAKLVGVSLEDVFGAKP